MESGHRDVAVSGRETRVLAVVGVVRICWW
jgi:hypothetical protein